MNASTTPPPQDAWTIRMLRRGIGVVGMALPFILVIGNAVLSRRFVLLGSVSGSYYTSMRDVFVGGMCAIGVFLICYRYERLDDVLGTIAGVLAVMVALFRTLPDRRVVAVTGTDTLIGRVHAFSAAGLFVLLAFFCLFLFTRTGPGGMTPRKRTRNRIYRACGGVILACILVALLANFLPGSVRGSVKPLFWCEAVAVLAFGAAWLVKGETVARDEAAPVAPPAPVPAGDVPVA